MHWLHDLLEWTLNLAHTPYASWGLFGVAFAEASFFPIPPDLLQIALSTLNPAKSFWYAGIALAGTVTGAVLGYGIGRFGGRPLLDRFISKEKLALVENAFQKYDVWAIGIAGFTPIPYKIFAISGGAFRIDFLRFVCVSILSRGARFFLVAVCFALFGEAIKNAVLKNINLFSILFVVLLIGGYVVITLVSKNWKRS